MWIFPHQQAEKSLQNQHVLSILQVGSHQLQYRFFRTKKRKSHHKTNTFCPITPVQCRPARHNKTARRAARRKTERATGIEPASEAWEASILPMNYARNSSSRRNRPVDHSVTTDGHATGVSRTVLCSRRGVLCDGGCRAALDDKVASANACTPIQRGGGSAHRSCRSSRLAVRSEMVPVLLSVLTVDTLRIA